MAQTLDVISKTRLGYLCISPATGEFSSSSNGAFFMNNNWQHNARNTLKGADSCNTFFQSQRFQDQGFPIKIPLEFANLIDKSNPNDPLLKQVIPSIKPQIETPGFSIAQDYLKNQLPNLECSCHLRPFLPFF
jgi:hypothetical protein